MFFLFLLVNSYVFGQIGDFGKFKKLKDLKNLENNMFGFNTVEILEQEYYESKKQRYDIKVEHNHEPSDTTNDHEFELTERNIPLEMDL